MKNRIFFPQSALDEWIATDRIELKGDELLIRGENRRYKIIEAVRVLQEVTGAADIYEVVGRVKTRAFLSELGAEILESSMIIGDNAYDVVQGFVGAPSVSLSDHRKATPLPATPQSPAAKTDEDLLAAFLATKL